MSAELNCMGAPILRGIRGRAGADLGAIRDLLLQVSSFAETIPGLREMDLNPVIVRESGLSIVDARVVLDR